MNLASLRHGIISIPHSWICLVFRLILQACYNFSNGFILISPEIMEKKNMSKTQLSIMSFLKGSFAEFSILAGFLFYLIIEIRHHQPHSHLRRFGVHVLLGLAAILTFLCYLLIWLDLHDMLRSHKGLYYVYTGLLSHSASVVYTGNVMMAYFNFPLQRGAVVSLVQGFYIMSGYVFADLNKVFFNGHGGEFMMVMGATPRVASLVCLFFISFRVVGANEDEVNQTLSILFSYTYLVMGSVLFVISLTDNVYDYKRSHKWAAVLTHLFIFLGVTSPVLMYTLWRARFDGPDAMEAAAAQRPAARNAATAATEAATAEAAGHHVGCWGYIASVGDVLTTLRFWVFFISCALTAATKESLDDNLRGFGESFHMSELQIDNLLCVSSICCFVVTLAVGFLSDIVLRRYGFGRPWLMALSPLWMVIGLVVCMYDSFYLGMVIALGAYGCMDGLMPTIAGEIFELKHAGIVCPLIELASGIISTWILDKLEWVKNHNHYGGFVTYMIPTLVAVLACFMLGYLTQQNVYTPMKVAVN